MLIILSLLVITMYSYPRTKVSRFLVRNDVCLLCNERIWTSDQQHVTQEAAPALQLFAKVLHFI